MTRDITQLQVQAARVAEIYAENFDVPTTSEWTLLKLNEEMGELTSAWLSAHGQSRKTADTQALADELADVLGFLLVLAEREGIDPAQAFADKWGKYLTTD